MTEISEMKTATPVSTTFTPKEASELMGVMIKSFNRQCEELDKKCRKFNRGIMDRNGKLSFFPRNDLNYRIFYEEDMDYLQDFKDLRAEGKTIEEAAEALVLQRYSSEILDADETPAPQATTETGIATGMPMLTEEAFRYMLKASMQEALDELSDKIEKRNEEIMQKYSDQWARIEEKQDRLLALEKRTAEVIPMAEKEIIVGKTLEELLAEPEKTVLKVVPDQPKEAKAEEPKKEVPLDIFPEAPAPESIAGKNAADSLTAEKPAFKMSTETVNKLNVTEVSAKKDGPFSKLKNFFVK